MEWCFRSFNHLLVNGVFFSFFFRCSNNLPFHSLSGANCLFFFCVLRTRSFLLWCSVSFHFSFTQWTLFACVIQFFQQTVSKTPNLFCRGFCFYEMTLIIIIWQLKHFLHTFLYSLSFHIYSFLFHLNVCVLLGLGFRSKCILCANSKYLCHPSSGFQINRSWNLLMFNICFLFLYRKRNRKIKFHLQL